MTEIVQYNTLAEDLNKYDYLNVWVDSMGLHVLNLDINKEIILYREPVFAVWGMFENKNTGEEKIIRKSQFIRALKHLYRIADEINNSNTLFDT